MDNGYLAGRVACSGAHAHGVLELVHAYWESREDEVEVDEELQKLLKNLQLEAGAAERAAEDALAVLGPKKPTKSD